MKSRSILSHRLTVFFLACLIAAFTQAAAHASGFALIEQSVSGLGNAYSGGAAAAEDASTIFYNPAGLTRLQGTQILPGAHVIIPSAKFSNDGSTRFTGAPLSGGNGGDGGVTKVIPNFYASTQVGKVYFGLGVNAPFGLATKYDSGWVGRYHAIESDVLTININPSIAFKATDNLSIGAGLSAQYLKAKLSNAIDVGGISFARSRNPLALSLSDGFVELNGDSWGFGFNLGALYEFSKDTRVGISYRSRIKHKLEGDADFSGTDALAAAAGFFDRSVYANIMLPDSASVSFVHSFSPQWTVMADFTWTNWSLFKELRVQFDPVAGRTTAADSVTTENWRDNYRYSIGVSYMPDPKWTFRSGVAYDTAAVRNAEYRTPRIPDADRIWLALGAGYKLSDNFAVDLGYAHIFVKDSRIGKTATGPTDENFFRGNLHGSYDSHINIISAQAKITF